MDEAYEVLIKLAGIVGAITAIIVFIFKAVMSVKKAIGFFVGLRDGLNRLEKEQQRQADEISNINTVVSNLEEKITKVEEHDMENYMRQLQLIIMSEEMPLPERIRAGDKYLANNGNGAVKVKLELLKERYSNESKAE